MKSAGPWNYKQIQNLSVEIFPKLKGLQTGKNNNNNPHENYNAHKEMTVMKENLQMQQ